MFFHDIYFCNVVLVDFVTGVLQPSFQHVEDSRLNGSHSSSSHSSSYK